MVIEADRVSKSYDRPVVRDFSLKIHRGDRIAVIGPNGAGKTTLLKLLTGQIEPDGGRVRLGNNLEIAYFDQNRERLSPDLSLWENLTGDPEMRVSGKADQIMVRGTPKHVVGYLKEFLFDEQRARAPVRSLSGGEKARLMLARLMARPSNLLVLDEPTNDLDMETLDLLQELLGDYPGTVLLVGHDRDFIDRIADTTILMERGGRATGHAGGWSDIAERLGGKVPSGKPKPAKPVAKSTTKPAKPVPKRNGDAAGLSYTEIHRLEELPSLIERTEAEIAKLEQFLSDPDLFATSPAKFRKASDALAERGKLLVEMEKEWLELEERSAE